MLPYVMKMAVSHASEFWDFEAQWEVNFSKCVLYGAYERDSSVD